jgi:hypothetical protein
MQGASTRAQHSHASRGKKEGGLFRRKSLLGWLTPPPFFWLTFPSSSHSHSVILTVIPKIRFKLSGTAIAPAISMRFEPAFVIINFVIYSGSPTGYYNPDTQARAMNHV